MSKWNEEYLKQGIPSSYRNKPSGVLKWALDNWPIITKTQLPNRAVDIGCGTGRNSVYMSSLGIEVLGFDFSDIAIEHAQNRMQTSHLNYIPSFKVHDLTTGIPGNDSEFDFAIDVFVYKHQIASATRTKYRKELHRVLNPDGLLLVSLADREDGYYKNCPDSEISEIGNPRTIIDEKAGIASVLFNVEELIHEMSDFFDLSMCWCKTKQGKMHGNKYLRRTIATIWRRKN
jgi:methyl halide transferase